MTNFLFIERKKNNTEQYDIISELTSSHIDGLDNMELYQLIVYLNISGVENVIEPNCYDFKNQYRSSKTHRLPLVNYDHKLIHW